MGDWSGSFANVDDVKGSEDSPDNGTTEVEESGSGATQAGDEFWFDEFMILAE